MFAGFGYAVTAVDGRGNHVCPERAVIEDLDQCYGYVLDFMGNAEGDALFADALDRLYIPHYGVDEEEPSITWEVRCMPLLAVL